MCKSTVIISVLTSYVSGTRVTGRSKVGRLYALGNYIIHRRLYKTTGSPDFREETQELIILNPYPSIYLVAIYL